MNLRALLASAVALSLAPSVLLGIVPPLGCRCGAADPSPVATFRRRGGLLGIGGVWRSCGRPGPEDGVLQALVTLRESRGALAAAEPLARCRASHGYALLCWRTPWTWHALALPIAAGASGDRAFYVDSEGAAVARRLPSGGAWQPLGQ